MDLFATRGTERLHERVHVLPAVELTDAADISLGDRLGRVAGAVAEDQSLDMGGADLAAVVDDITRRGDEHLGRVETGKVQLGVAQRDIDLVGAGCLADATHLIRVGGETVLPVLLEEGQAFLVVELPGPVGVAGDPWFFTTVRTCFEVESRFSSKD